MHCNVYFRHSLQGLLMNSFSYVSPWIRVFYFDCWDCFQKKKIGVVHLYSVICYWYLCLCISLWGFGSCKVYKAKMDKGYIKSRGMDKCKRACFNCVFLWIGFHLLSPLLLVFLAGGFLSWRSRELAKKKPWLWLMYGFWILGFCFAYEHVSFL